MKWSQNCSVQSAKGSSSHGMIGIGLNHNFQRMKSEAFRLFLKGHMFSLWHAKTFYLRNPWELTFKPPQHLSHNNQSILSQNQSKHSFFSITVLSHFVLLSASITTAMCINPTGSNENVVKHIIKDAKWKLTSACYTSSHQPVSSRLLTAMPK